MSLSLDDIDFLTRARGAMLLERLYSDDLRDSHVLTVLTRLRKEYTTDQARAAVELVRLRVRAAEKFGAHARQLFFTRDALEQASDPRISRYRARTTHAEHVVDVCCSIGTDALAFAQAGAHVVGIDIDPVRIRMAQLNAQAVGASAHFHVHDAHTYQPPDDVQRIFFDPARRGDDGVRIVDVERYQPPLSLVKNWRVPRTVVKLSPGVQIEHVRAYGGVLEFISVNGDLKEASLAIVDGGAGGELTVQAALITDDHLLHWGHADQPVESRLSQPRAWLIEPDPALIRAGLVADAALRWGGFQLDDTIAYITADQAPHSPWARAWRVIDWLPFNLKKLRDVLRARGIGTVTVKKRGTIVTPETLIPQLRLKGEASCTVILTRLQGEQIVIVTEDYIALQDT